MADNVITTVIDRTYDELVAAYDAETVDLGREHAQESSSLLSDEPAPDYPTAIVARHEDWHDYDIQQFQYPEAHVLDDTWLVARGEPEYDHSGYPFDGDIIAVEYDGTDPAATLWDALDEPSADYLGYSLVAGELGTADLAVNTDNRYGSQVADTVTAQSDLFTTTDGRHPSITWLQTDEYTEEHVDLLTDSIDTVLRTYTDNRDRTASPADLKRSVLQELGDDRKSVDDVAETLEPYDREDVRVALRELFREGEVTETPDWNYRRVYRVEDSAYLDDT